MNFFLILYKIAVDVPYLMEKAAFIPLQVYLLGEELGEIRIPSGKLPHSYYFTILSLNSLAKEVIKTRF